MTLPLGVPTALVPRGEPQTPPGPTVLFFGRLSAYKGLEILYAALANAPGKTDRTMALYVPNATTIFDFTRRAMPWPQPKSLSNDEVYALTAYILALNKLIGDNDTMNAETLPKVRMPNRDGFIVRFPEAL